MSSRISFGLFEADLKSGELWKAGFRVKLQSQPFKVLAILLERAGEIVSREELQLRVWGPDVTVEFEQSLGSAIKKVREALGDSAVNPRFIETLSRRGYRFIAPVTAAESLNQPIPSVVSPGISPEPATAPVPVSEASAIERESTPAGPTFWTAPVLLPTVLAFLVGIVVTTATVRLWHPRQPSPTLPRITQITWEGRVYSPQDFTIETLPGSFTDGAYLYTSAVENGHIDLSRISVPTGEMQVLPLPSQIAAPEISALSLDGSRLLVRSHLTAASQQPLWVLPVAGGSAFKVPNILAQDATWMPDGKEILTASGGQISVVSPETGKASLFATVSGRAFWLRWSPDGRLLRFTVIDPIDHSSSLWEIREGERVAHSLMTNWVTPPNECCGTWTGDGHSFVFQATENGHTDLWRLNDDSKIPVRVTNGPLDNEAPAAGPKGEQLFFVGHDLRSKLERYDPVSKQFTPLRNFLSNASRVRFSRDGQWVVWTDVNGHLWRARANGTESVRLTPELMNVFLAAWSPDGSRLALMARYPGRPWQIYTMSADGGSLQALMNQDRNMGDPSFSPDGRYIVFGRVPDIMGQESPRPLEIFDLTTNNVSQIPQSRGLFSPRWSPDGRYIAALTLDQQKVMLFDTAAHSWRTLAATSSADPVWSSDSKTLFIHAYMAESKPIYGISVPDGKLEEEGSLKSLVSDNATQYFFSGVTPENIPLVRVETSSGNLYELNLTGSATSSEP